MVEIKMDALRSFSSNNRGSIVNIIYIIAFLVALYYLYKFWVAGNEYDLDILLKKTPANGQPIVKPFVGPGIDQTLVRIRTGGEYTFSFWMYVDSWDYRPGKPKCVFTLQDKDMNEKGYYLMTGTLYPNESKMMIRTYTGSNTGADMTNIKTYSSLFAANSPEGAQLYSPSGNMPMCDVQEVDLQRWVHVAISVNGRIVDVYMDGKLARSCILPEVPQAGTNGLQAVVMCPHGGFSGYVSGVKMFGYAVTPDRIYAQYQAGPYSGSNFMTYIAEKLGINLTYIGAGGARKTLGSEDALSSGLAAVGF
jgi:hypothetical protein